MSELYSVLILKGLGWLLMARFAPYSRTDVAQDSPHLERPLECRTMRFVDWAGVRQRLLRASP